MSPNESNQALRDTGACGWSRSETCRNVFEVFDLVASWPHRSAAAIFVTRRLTITLAVPVIRYFVLVKFLVISRGSRRVAVAVAGALKLDAKFALATNVI